MLKRPLEDAETDSESRRPKRFRPGAATARVDRLSSLSDELLLNILSFLPIASLNMCQRLSRRFNALALDSELWKRQYYSRWVWPRARRLAHIRPATYSRSVPAYSPNVSDWLDHSHLASGGQDTNWKKQYRLRHNWSKGVCRVTEIELPQPTLPPTLVNLCLGVVFTADSNNGLRAWACPRAKACVASARFADASRKGPHPCPTALTATHGRRRKCIEVVVGFQDGTFQIYTFDTASSRLSLFFTGVGQEDGAITGMASSYPYILMVSRHKFLKLYDMTSISHHMSIKDPGGELSLLATLSADNILAPMSFSVRVAASEVIVSIVYSFSHLGCGWSLGIQELRFSRDGQPVGSRLATTIESQYGPRPLQNSTLSHSTRLPGADRGTDRELQFNSSGAPSILHLQPPTSMSYSHPYLLASHADNTLTMYLVVSTAESLFVKTGKRLWGHTSSVSAVQVSDRGKAISVSARGDEIRIWELEKAISTSRGANAFQAESSVQVSPGKDQGYPPCLPKRGSDDNRLGLQEYWTDQDLSREILQMQGCVGFNDEVVLLLREREAGRPLLECYDFT